MNMVYAAALLSCSGMDINQPQFYDRLITGIDHTHD